MRDDSMPRLYPKCFTTPVQIELVFSLDQTTPASIAAECGVLMIRTGGVPDRDDNLQGDLEVARRPAFDFSAFFAKGRTQFFSGLRSEAEFRGLRCLTPSLLVVALVRGHRSSGPGADAVFSAKPVGDCSYGLVRLQGKDGRERHLVSFHFD